MIKSAFRPLEIKVALKISRTGLDVDQSQHYKTAKMSQNAEEKVATRSEIVLAGPNDFLNVLG
ncbi:hypothetical protein [Lapidilactobacillus mulanensis]|nr:hypothetical protein [Lapidilactobacillus mulanensis]